MLICRAFTALAAPSSRGLGLALAMLLFASLACQAIGPSNGPAGRPTATEPGAVPRLTDFDPSQAGLRLLDPAGAAGATGRLDERDLPFLALFPELEDAAAPVWLRVGTRVTYRVESAMIAQVEDEDGAAGTGWVQYDTERAGADVVLASARLYLDPGDGTRPPLLIVPSLGLPGAGEYWLAPEALANAERVANAELSVARHPKQIAGETYQVVRFSYAADEARYTWEFDEVSGLLVWYSHELGDENDARRQLAVVTLAGVRQLDLPWSGGHRPSWVDGVRHLQYDGAQSTEIGGFVEASLAYSVAADLERCEGEWSVHRLSDTLEGRAVSTGVRVTGPVQIFDGLWLAPEALKALDHLGEGEVIDADPITGAEVSVGRAADGGLALTQTGPGYSVTLVYDGDGRLTGLTRVQQVGAATITTALKLTAWS